MLLICKYFFCLVVCLFAPIFALKAFEFDDYFSDCSSFESNVKKCSIDVCVLQDKKENFYQFISAGYFYDKCRFVTSYKDRLIVCMVPKDLLSDFSRSSMSLVTSEVGFSNFGNHCKLIGDGEGDKEFGFNYYKFGFIGLKAYKMMEKLSIDDFAISIIN